MKSPDRLSNDSGLALLDCPNLNIAKGPRHLRVLQELAVRPLLREELDKVAGASNGPEIVSALRKAGWRIPCERLSRKDRDGNSCRPGRYSLQPNQKALAAKVAFDGLKGARHG